MRHLITTGDRSRARMALERNFQKHRGRRMAPQYAVGATFVPCSPLLPQRRQARFGQRHVEEASGFDAGRDRHGHVLARRRRAHT